MDHDSNSSGHTKGKDLIPAMTPAISRPAFVSAHDCDVVAGVANVAIQQELSSMLGNELTHRLHETLRRTDMAAYGSNISLNDAQAYMHSRPLSYFNFISPSGPRIEDSISKGVGRTCQDFPLLGIALLYSHGWGSGQENPVLKKFSS